MFTTYKEKQTRTQKALYDAKFTYYKKECIAKLIDRLTMRLVTTA